MRASDLRDIEDFFDAYKVRYVELIKIKNHMPDSRILIMHFGSVIIECLLKYKLVKEKNYQKAYKRQWWYTEHEAHDVINRLLENNQIKDTLLTRDIFKNPGHKLLDIAREIEVINNMLEPGNELDRDLNILYNPCGIDNHCFIDLRYINDNNINDLDDIFEKWSTSFERVYNIIK